MEIGAASAVINPDVGSWVQGASVDNRADSIRDDLEANALYFTDTRVSLLLISCDVAGLLSGFVSQARDAMSTATGLPPRNIIIAGTHQHSGPVVIPTHPTKPLDEIFHARLLKSLIDLSKRAVNSARPGKVGWGKGLARVGYNRRCCWADGSHTMHGDGTREEFTGLEGPDDPQHTVLFARDFEGKIIAVLHHNTTHPTTFYGCNFFSAGIPGAARAQLREVLGEIPILFFNGAQGDISQDSQVTTGKTGEERENRLLRAAHLLSGETLRLLHESSVFEDPRLGHIFEDMKMDVRLPERHRVAWANEFIENSVTDEQVNKFTLMMAYGILRLDEEFGEQPFDTIPIHAIRIGDLLFVTQSCELYCQFGLDIKRRSPAPITVVVGLADGFNGYCPTTYGILGGGYSGEAIHWARLAVDAGYRIVDTASRLLYRVWR